MVTPTEVLQKHFTAQIDKHKLNVQILLENPRAIPEHTDFAEAVEKELEQVAHWNDMLEALRLCEQ